MIDRSAHKNKIQFRYAGKPPLMRMEAAGFVLPALHMERKGLQ